MLSFDQAKERLLAAARPVAECEVIDLADAGGRTLAVDLTASLSVPPFATAAMDGYAVRAGDVAAGCRLPVGQRLAAGAVPEPLPPGGAARIFTGAALPPGADAVVMQEYCRAENDQVTIDHPPAVGEHVRPAGSQLERGRVFLEAGQRLTAAALGLAASAGIGRIAVRRRLRVAVFFTGDELTEPGQPLPPGYIYNANRYLMRGFLHELGIDCLDLGIVADDFAATCAALRQAAAAADIVLTSGGMSEGDEDHVTAAVRREGRIDLWKIAAKPGKPLAFGAVRTADGETAFIGLPGNPVAVWSSLLTLVGPFLRRCQGLGRCEPERQRLRADFDYRVRGNRLEFVRVRRNADGGLDLYPNQDSAVIASAVWADGVVALPVGSEISVGDWVDYLPGPGWQP